MITFAAMKIGAWINKSKQHENLRVNQFIVKTFLSIPPRNPQHDFFFISSNELSSEFDIPAGTESIVVKQKMGLLKGLHLRGELRRVLKNRGADLLVSLGNSPLRTAPVPHCLIAGEVEKIHPEHLKNADAVIVFIKKDKDWLVSQYGLSPEKVNLVYPGASNDFKPISVAERQEIQARYSDGAEYFLFNSSFGNVDGLVDLLKSFSYFKKRQQSNLKLLITGVADPVIEKRIDGYKYRNDVRFTDANENMITAAAYAVVLPFCRNEDVVVALNTMRSATPVIAPKNSVINEIAGDAVMQSETNSIKDIADKMIRIYTDENYRSAIIGKGMTIAQEYTQEKTASSLSQAILKTLH